MSASVKLEKTIRGTFGTQNFATGAAQNADSLPTCVVLEEGTAMGYAGTVTNEATGLYECVLDCTAANGFEVGKTYTSYVVIIVDTVTKRGPVMGVSSFTIHANDIDDLATAANLATVLAAVDTEVAAILAAVDTEMSTVVTGVAALPALIAAVPDDTRDSILDFELRTGATLRGHWRLLDSLFFGKATGLIGLLATLFQPGGVTPEFTATQNPALGTREEVDRSTAEAP